MKKKLPIEAIQEVQWEDGKIFILYKDGTKMVAKADEIVLVSDYTNPNSHPLVDHCI